jgi:hypothetical protein
MDKRLAYAATNKNLHPNETLTAELRGEKVVALWRGIGREGESSGELLGLSRIDVEDWKRGELKVSAMRLVQEMGGLHRNRVLGSKTIFIALLYPFGDSGIEPIADDPTFGPSVRVTPNTQKS